MPLADLNAVCNLALDLLGEPYLGDYLTDTTTAAAACRQHLGPCVETVLEGHVWSFATRCSRLTAVPVASTTASLTTGSTAGDSALVWTAAAAGPAGNEISVTIAAADPLAVSVAVSTAAKGKSIIITPPGRPGTYTVTGSLGPNATGPVSNVAVPRPSTHPGTPQWSSDGEGSHPATGEWKTLYVGWMVAPATASLEEIAPKANYHASGNVSLGSLVTTRSAGGTLSSYVLFEAAGLTKWIRLGDGYDDRGETEIEEDTWLWINPKAAGTNWKGGLGAQWFASGDTDWAHILEYRVDAAITGAWRGVGKNPEASSWTPFSPATGTPSFEAFVADSAADVRDEVLLNSSASGLLTVSLPAGTTGSGRVTPVSATYLAGGSSTSSVFAPAFGSAFNLPDDCLRVIKLDGDDPDRPQNRWEILGRNLLLHEGNAEAPVIHYITMDPPVDEWPTTFTDAVAWLLASRLAPKLAQDETLANGFFQKHEIALGKARSKDARETRSRENHGPRQLAARSGLVNARYGNSRPPY